MGNIPARAEYDDRVELRRRREDRRRLSIERRIIRRNIDAFNLPEPQFVSNFRLTREAVQYIILSIGDELEAQRGPRAHFIPVPNRILSALYFLANGSYQGAVGNNMLSNMSQASVSRCIREVTQQLVLWGLNNFLRFPTTEVERTSVKNGFLARYGLPGIMGCVDGTHIAIKPPSVRERSYVNRKGYHSINTQIVCDVNLRIVNIVAKFPGASHDSYVWQSSRLSDILRGNYLHGDRDTRLLGDSGYPLYPWLLTPYPNPRPNTHESLFNNYHINGRNCVERCIGLWKARFRCLLRDRTLHYEPNAACRIIMACAVLHNIALRYRLDDPLPQFDEVDMMVAVPPPPELHGPRDIDRNLGQRTRDEYARSLLQFHHP